MVVNSNFDSDPGMIFYFSGGAILLYMAATFLPRLAVTVRRLHDTGKSGWYYLLAFTPYIGGMIIIILMCMDIDNFSNKWGLSPNTPVEKINEIGKL